MSGGGWIVRARLDVSDRSLLYNGTAVADITLDTKVRVKLYLYIRLPTFETAIIFEYEK